jgi:hypothetical protein
MLHAEVSSAVQASLETVWNLFVDKIENPGRYIKAVTGSTIVARYDDGVLREMHTDKMTIRERITVDERERKVTFTLVDHPLFTGETTNQIIPAPRGAAATEPLTVRFVLRWEPRSEESEKIVTQKEIESVTHHAVLDLKTIAEERDAKV